MTFFQLIMEGGGASDPYFSSTIITFLVRKPSRTLVGVDANLKSAFHRFLLLTVALVRRYSMECN